MSESIEEFFSLREADQPGAPVDHSAWADILARFVRRDPSGLNRVDYAGIKAHALRELGAYIGRLQGTDVRALPRDEQFAFWINLYNAVTVRVVAEHYPVASIRDITLGGGIVASLMGGPWKAMTTAVSGIAFSLDDIEHTILRGIFKDPRLHYAINCGSVGCPNLRTEPFRGATLERDLDAAAREFLNSQRGVAIEGGKLVLSGILKWYRRDFGGDERAVLAHVARYAEGERAEAIARGLAVARYDYDWSLNGADR